MSGRFQVRLELEGEGEDTAVALANDGGKLMVKKPDGSSYEVRDIATVPYGSDLAVDGQDVSLLSQDGGVLATVQTKDTVYDLPIATEEELGGIRPDGTTIVVNSATGVATVVGDGDGGMVNPMTAVGDIIVGGEDGAPTCLPMGTAGQGLRINATGDGIAWEDGGDSVTAQDIPGSYSISLTIGASGTSFTAPANGWVNIIASTSVSNGLVTVTIGGGAYAVGAISYSSARTIYLLCPIRAGASFVVTHNNVTITSAKFIYTIGATPPQPEIGG